MRGVGFSFEAVFSSDFEPTNSFSECTRRFLHAWSEPLIREWILSPPPLDQSVFLSSLGDPRNAFSGIDITRFSLFKVMFILLGGSTVLKAGKMIYLLVSKAY